MEQPNQVQNAIHNEKQNIFARRKDKLLRHAEVELFKAREMVPLISLAELHKVYYRWNARLIFLNMYQSSFVILFYKQASKVGKEIIDEQSDSELPMACPCCGKHIKKQQLSLHCNNLDLSFLGSGYPMYFEFMGFCVILQAILLFVNGFFGILTNSIFGSECLTQSEIDSLPEDQKNNQCYKSWVTILSLGNKKSQQELMQTQSFLNVISIFIIIIAFQRFRLKQRQIDIDCDENVISANDYTALFSNLPSSLTSSMKQLNNNESEQQQFSEQLRLHFQDNLVPGQKTEIIKVGLCFNCDEIFEIEQRIETLTLHKQALLIAKMKTEKVENQLIVCQQQKKVKEKKYCYHLTPEFIRDNFTGYAYVIFQKEEDKEAVIKKYQKYSFLERILFMKKSEEFKVNENIIKIEQAADPNNIYWRNLKFSPLEKNIRKAICYTITILSLCGCLGIILGLSYAQRKLNSDKERFSVSLVSIAISACIAILNPILRTLVTLIAKKTGCTTRTSVFVTVAACSSVAQFMNSSIILILIQLFITQKGSIYGRIFGSGGLALNVSTVFILQMIATNVVKFLNIPYLLKELIRRILQRFFKYFTKITQSQLNSIFEEYEFSIEDEYGFNIQVVYSALFYAPVFPICLVWGILTILIKTYVDKYNLIRKSTVKFNPSLNLCLQMTEMLEYCLPLYSLGNMFAFIFISQGEISTIAIFGFLAGLAHAFLPMQMVNEKLFVLRQRLPNIKTYDEVRDFLNIDYDRENPVIRDIAIEEHINSLKFRETNKKDNSMLEKSRVEKPNNNNNNNLESDLLVSNFNSATRNLDSLKNEAGQLKNDSINPTSPYRQQQGQMVFSLFKSQLKSNLTDNNHENSINSNNNQIVSLKQSINNDEEYKETQKIIQIDTSSSKEDNGNNKNNSDYQNKDVFLNLCNTPQRKYSLEISEPSPFYSEYKMSSYQKKQTGLLENTKLQSNVEDDIEQQQKLNEQKYQQNFDLDNYSSNSNCLQKYENEKIDLKAQTKVKKIPSMVKEIENVVDIFNEGTESDEDGQQLELKIKGVNLKIS